MVHCDYVVIGAGIAGASIGYYLSHHGKVVVLEQEAQAGYHATGRSGAYFLELYGNDTIQRLTTASRRFFEHPPQGFCQYPLFDHGGSLHIAREDQLEELEQLYDQIKTRKPMAVRQGGEFACEQVPLLRSDRVRACLWDSSARAIDVDGLLQGYLRGVRNNLGLVAFDARVTGLERDTSSDDWTVSTASQQYQAPIVVNAAGAWVDEIAGLAGIAPSGIQPKRRTAILVDPGPQYDVRGWPMVIDIDEEFYFKPDAGKLMVSPADETLSPPTDAQPEDIDVATAAYRLEQISSVKVDRIEHRWAGLRSFYADKTPLVDFDPGVTGFFWFAGQGGYGIQIAPALAQIGAAQMAGQTIPSHIQELGVTAHLLSFSRFKELQEHSVTS